LVCVCLFPVLPIDVKQFFDGWIICMMGMSFPANTSQAHRQAIDDAGQLFLADACELAEASIVRSRFQVFKRIDSQLVMEALGQHMADSGDRFEQGDWIRLAT
jgi:hypothetical protein